MSSKFANENVNRIEQEMGFLLKSCDWDSRPIKSKQFVQIVAYLIEIARLSGLRPDMTSDLLVEAMQEAQKIFDRNKLIL